MMLRSLVFGCLVLASAGCKDPSTSPAAGAPAAPQVEEQGSFLNEPAGVPPDVLTPERVQIRIVAATDRDKVRVALKQLSGGKAGTIVEVGSELRMEIGGLKDAHQDELVALRNSGARGNLVLWYPLKTIRKRLLDGRAGVWRGIVRARNTMPTRDGIRLGGTPVFLAGVLPKVDAALLGSGPPPGFTRVADEGEHTVLTPRSPSVMDGGFDEAVEALTPIMKQGGDVWLLIALPLAEEHKPERF